MRLGLKADEIAVGSAYVATNYRVTVVRDSLGLFAVYLICTHLGCTPYYYSDAVGDLGEPFRTEAIRRMNGGPDAKPSGFVCPCHGAKYYVDGTNFFGPAPRPMDWIDLSVDPDGYLVIDRGTIVAHRKVGENDQPQWRLDPVTGISNGLTVGV